MQGVSSDVKFNPKLRCKLHRCFTECFIVFQLVVLIFVQTHQQPFFPSTQEADFLLFTACGNRQQTHSEEVNSEHREGQV